MLDGESFSRSPRTRAASHSSAARSARPALYSTSAALSAAAHAASASGAESGAAPAVHAAHRRIHATSQLRISLDVTRPAWYRQARMAAPRWLLASSAVALVAALFF